MTTHVESALFLYVPETEKLKNDLVENPYGTKISPVVLQEFLDSPERYLHQQDHAVIAAPQPEVKAVVALAMKYDFSIGLIPVAGQKDLRNCYGLSAKLDDAIDTALGNDPQVMDIIRCNDKILLFKATIGRLPLVDSPSNIHWTQAITRAFKQFVDLKLLSFQINSAGHKTIKTAASGGMIIQHHERTLASKLISHDSCLTDGMISMVISAPTSILGYCRFLFQTFRFQGQRVKIPDTIGYIKSPHITIETEPVLRVSLDNIETTQTPIRCETVPRAVRINVGEGLRKKSKPSGSSVHEQFEIKNLPAGKELSKATNKRLPFFSYASEERFRDLFLSLREDARIHPTYLVLMVLSTMLAGVGLYLSSSAVVIGAMILAPLMAPIVSLAMGLLRSDTKLSRSSMMTIAVGIIISLSAASLLSFLFPHKPITMEMQARLNPSLLDLGVAVIAGIAGAYTKSHKEVLQSLAGVSIAVALVPPLAVAGIGLGMGDLNFFSQAFLLFSTNLIGITLAAAITFRILGYSPVVRNKRGMAMVALVMAVISIPLYLSYQQLVETTILEKSWEYERFLINDKYLIVQHAQHVRQRKHDLLFVRVLVRESLTRNDLNQLRKRIESYFGSTLDIRVDVTYIP